MNAGLRSRQTGGRITSVVRGWRFAKVSGPVCVIGDIHGYTDKLKALWDRLPSAVGGEDIFERMHVVFLGDYCDKGPDTKGTIEWLTQLGTLYPHQKHYFLAGNHDFALSAFLGLLPERNSSSESLRRRLSDDPYRNTPFLEENALAAFKPPPQGDYSKTWREQYRSKFVDEKLYDGPGHERMHLQGVRYASKPVSVFDSAPTFESYGVDYADREGLLQAMPLSHQEFLFNLRWIVKLRSTIGDILAVHAGLEDEPLNMIDRMVQGLRHKDPALLHEPFIEPLSGRANVERMPNALLAPILQSKGYTPPPLFLISGHHGFVRVNGRRIVLDMGGGREEKDLCALVLSRQGVGSTHTQLSNDHGISLDIVTSSSPPRNRVSYMY